MVSPSFLVEYLYEERVRFPELDFIPGHSSMFFLLDVAKHSTLLTALLW